MSDRVIQDRPAPMAQDVAHSAHRPGARSGVQGWLLALCVMLTVVGPVIAVGLMAHEYMTSSHATSPWSGSFVAFWISMVLSASTVAFGIYAGLHLWTIQPNAVHTTKTALLFGLVADIVSTGISVAAAPDSPADAHFLNLTLLNVVPSLVFFTVCFAYLNRSERVAATYSAQGLAGVNTKPSVQSID